MLCVVHVSGLRNAHREAASVRSGRGQEQVESVPDDGAANLPRSEGTLHRLRVLGAAGLQVVGRWQVAL